MTIKKISYGSKTWNKICPEEQNNCDCGVELYPGLEYEGHGLSRHESKRKVRPIH